MAWLYRNAGAACALSLSHHSLLKATLSPEPSEAGRRQRKEAENMNGSCIGLSRGQIGVCAHNVPLRQ